MCDDLIHTDNLFYLETHTHMGEQSGSYRTDAPLHFKPSSVMIGERIHCVTSCSYCSLEQSCSSHTDDMIKGLMVSAFYYYHTQDRRP